MGSLLLPTSGWRSCSRTTTYISIYIVLVVPPPSAPLTERPVHCIAPFQKELSAEKLRLVVLSVVTIVPRRAHLARRHHREGKKAKSFFLFTIFKMGYILQPCILPNVLALYWLIQCNQNLSSKVPRWEKNEIIFWKSSLRVTPSYIDVANIIGQIFYFCDGPQPGQNVNLKLCHSFLKKYFNNTAWKD